MQLNGTRDAFTISDGSVAGTVQIQGNSVPSVTAGLGWYLKHVANCSVAWSGTQLAPIANAGTTGVLPPVGTPITKNSQVDFRYFANVSGTAP